MRITSIIENTSNKGLPVEHGLSLYIERDEGQKVLFDMGQSDLFVRNAAALSLSIADIDVAVVSHGHYDHGGGLQAFFLENSKAKVYVHKDAFRPHYSLRETGLRYIGLEESLQRNERLVLCEDEIRLDNGMSLFANVQGDSYNPFGNRLLFGPSQTENDSFSHEQNLIIAEEDKLVLFAGCAHRGIVNIIHKAEEFIGRVPTHVFAGMHLMKSRIYERYEDRFIESLASELMNYPQTMFYTMHCTGVEQYQKLKLHMSQQIEYLACGDSVII